AHVVQLRRRRADEMKAIADQRPELAPAEVNARVERFRVERSRGLLVEIEKRVPAPLRSGRSGDGGDRRKDVDQRGGLVDRLPGTPRGRQLHEERYVQILAVEENAVL